MIRYQLFAGLLGLATTITASAFAGTPQVSDDTRTTMLEAYEKATSEFVEAPGMATLYYPESMSQGEFLDRARGDAEALGFEFVKTLASSRTLIVKATPAEASEQLRHLEGTLPIVNVAPSYRLSGRWELQSLACLSSEMLLRFKQGTTETAKAEFLARHGFERLLENSQGTMLVETGRQPDAGMIDFAADLLRSENDLEFSHFSFSATGELASNDSIQIEDEYWELQWNLWDAGFNNFLTISTNDQDIDAPRSWQINVKRGVEHPYGDPSITVGVFDTGLEISPEGHPDIDANIDPRFGLDLVDGGVPNPVFSSFGAHGTLVTGLIAAAKNDIGIIGAAPGVKIYTYRIFGQDMSFDSNDLRLAIEDSIDRNIDVNVHPYVLPFGVNESSATTTDAAYQLSNESGRVGRGTANFAAAGNFFSAVEYPGSSVQTVAVGAIGPDGERVLYSNWGGDGIDIVQPAYNMDPDVYGLQSSPLILTDLSGTQGWDTDSGAEGDYFQAGLPLTGFLDFLEETIAYELDGTSFAAAQAAANAALLLSDERYTNLSPFFSRRYWAQDEENNILRIPDPENSESQDTLLGEMAYYADRPGPMLNDVNSANSGLPSNASTLEQYEYINHYNEFFGYGRPNASRLLPPDQNTDTYKSGKNRSLDPQLTDPFARALVQARWEFGKPGPPNATVIQEEPEDQTVDWFGDFNQGWLPDGTNQVEAFLTQEQIDEDEPIIISPFLEGVPFLVFEDGRVIPQQPSGDNVLYVWTDSYTTTTFAMETQPQTVDAGENLVYNPNGTYFAGETIGIYSPEFRVLGALRGPMFVEMEIAHELGVENASSGTPGQQVTPFAEVDTLELVVEEVGGQSQIPATYTAAVITGDSWEGRKQRLIGGQVSEISGQEIATWPTGYLPQVNPLIIRKYRFFFPDFHSISAGENATYKFHLLLKPGPSYLPTYGPGGGQILNVFRDYKGFQLYSMNAYTARGGTGGTQHLEYLNDHVDTTIISDPASDINSASFPVYSAKGNEIFAAQIGSGTSRGRSLTSYPAQPRWLDKEGVDVEMSGDGQVAVIVGPEDIFRRASTQLTTFDENITGLDHHPFYDFLILSTAETGEEPAGIWYVTNDGVDAYRLLPESETVGAHEPQWANAGDQFAYAGFDYVKVANLISYDEGGITIDTPVTPELTGLIDFYSPALTDDSGLILFSAREDDGSGNPTGNANIYAALRTGRIVSPNGVGMPLFDGWQATDMTDLEISPDGKRLMFTANAGSIPSEGSPAFAVSERNIFIVNNLENIIQFGNEPAYQAVTKQFVPMARTNTARWPRFSPDGRRIVYAGFNFPVDLDEYLTSRLIAHDVPVQTVGSPDPTPTPTAATPTPDPTATPPNPDNADVIQQGRYGFSLDDEGWVFGSAAPAYKAPTPSFTAGSIALNSNNSNSTFGFYDSPSKAIRVLPDSLYLYRARVRGDATSNDMVPTFRQRVNSFNFESAFTSVTNSMGDGTLSPATGSSRWFDLLFRPPQLLFMEDSSQWNYRMSFDLLNFLDDDPNGGLILEEVRIYRLDDELNSIDPDDRSGTVVKNVQELFNTDLNTGAARDPWVSGSTEEFTDPIWQETPAGLGMSVSDAQNTFGFWSLDGAASPGSLPSTGPAIFRMYSPVVSDFEDNPATNPDFRLRFSTNDFQRTATQVLVSQFPNVITPQPGRPSEAPTYMVLERIPNFSSFNLAFDVLSFKGEGATVSGEMYVLDGVVLERVEIPSYPPYED